MRVRLLSVVLLLALAAPAGGVSVSVQGGVTYGGGGGKALKAGLYLPPAAQRRPVGVVMVHGGGWIYNKRSIIAPHAQSLAERSGFVVLNIDYPTRPDGGALPGRQQRAVAASVRWLRAHAGELGIDPTRL